MISNGKSQLRLRRIGASISACFNIVNARFPSSSMMKSLSLQRRVVSGLETLAKLMQDRGANPVTHRDTRGETMGRISPGDLQ